MIYKFSIHGYLPFLYIVVSSLVNSPHLKLKVMQETRYCTVLVNTHGRLRRLNDQTVPDSSSGRESALGAGGRCHVIPKLLKMVQVVDLLGA